jgi:ABC-type transport system involved in multi-copper enzyme maturation permease subunit
LAKDLETQMTNWCIVAAVSPWISNWLTPVWLLGVGALAGLAVLFVLWALAYVISRLPILGDLDGVLRSNGGSRTLAAILRPLTAPISRRTVDEVPAAVREGVLWPLFLVTASVAVFGVVGALLVQEPASLLRSLRRLPYVGTETVEFSIEVSEPVDPEDEFSDLTEATVTLPSRIDELRSVALLSDQDLTVATRPFIEVQPGATLDVIADEPAVWLQGERTVTPADEADVLNLHIRNLGSETAKVSVTIETAPPHPEVITIPIMAFAVVFIFLLYLCQRSVAPRLSAVALSTFKSEVAQPLFLIIMALGAFSLALFVWIPYNTFGEDIKMLKDSGLTLIMILGIIQAVWAASTSISEEIEGRTALTVLSKPIGRRSFILGKFLGIVWTVALLFVVLGIVFLIAVAYKPIYDARESTTQDVTWQLCHLEMIYTVPGLVLAFMETIVLAALSVAISTRLPLLANFVICFTIYLLGHLIPLIVQSSAGQFEFVQFFGQLIGTVLPVLDHFNIQAAVAAGAEVPYEYLGWTFVYCSIFSVIAMLLALVLFEDRDLA